MAGGVWWPLVRCKHPKRVELERVPGDNLQHTVGSGVVWCLQSAQRYRCWLAHVQCSRRLARADVRVPRRCESWRPEPA